MDIILSKRPAAQIENADTKIKEYILFLERKLQNCFTMSKINEGIELKFLNQQQCYEQEIQKLKAENTNLDTENRRLKLTIDMLEREIQLKRIDQNIKTSETASNRKEVYRAQLNNTNDNDPYANSVLVKGLNEKQLSSNYKKVIIKLSLVMDMELKDRDIVKVSKLERKFYEKHNLKPDNIMLIVQFAKPEVKVQFLKNKEKLKLHSYYDDIEINDYVSDEVYNLYQYAKVLKNCGYALIYWRNNCVYAKKTRSTYCEPILIKSKYDVDALKKI